MSDSREFVIKIKGLDCISCAKNLKHSLQSKVGKNINFIDIDFATQKMFVIVNPGFDISNIIREIKKLGYQAEIQTEFVSSEKHNHWEILNLISSIVLSIFVFITCMFFHSSIYSSKLIAYTVIFATSFVQFVNGYRFYRSVFYSLKNMTLNMDLLIVISTTTAYFYSLYAYFNNIHKLYFETSCIIISVLLIGRYIENRYKKQGMYSVLNLLTYRPVKVNGLVDNHWTSMDVDQIKEGDILEIVKGQSIPVDGQVVEGEGLVDLSLIFGENQPKVVEKGEIVPAGSFLIDGTIKIKSLVDYNKSFWKGMEITLYNLTSKASNYQRFIDKLSGNFVIVIVFLALGSFVYWYISGNYQMALNSLISTLIIACPCAIGLASPLAINKGMLETSKKHIIIKDPYVFEKISKAQKFVFDKTGTITNKNLKINSLEFVNQSETNTFLELLMIGVSKSNHPISVGIKNYILSMYNLDLDRLLTNYHIHEFKEVSSEGIILKAKHKENKQFYTLLLGNPMFIKKNLQNQKEYQTISSSTYAILLKDNDPINTCIFSYREEINQGVMEALKTIQKSNKEIYILTGSSKESTFEITKQLSIESDKVICSVDSVSKVRIIENLKNKQNSKSNEYVVFIGDGINDSLAMTVADVGISFEYGSDITQNSAKVILKEISQLKELIKISDEVFKKLRFNIFWVFGYNSFFVPLAMGMLVGFGITVNPILAAIIMVMSDFSLLFFNLTNIVPVYNKLE
ncbi:MAG: cation-translocating P-type ATPase [bacterium]